MAAMGLASPVGIAIIGGVAAEAMGVAAFFVADGPVCIALGLTVYLFKSVRALDHDEPHVLRDDSAAEANAEIGAVPGRGLAALFARDIETGAVRHRRAAPFRRVREGLAFGAALRLHYRSRPAP